MVRNVRAMMRCDTKVFSLCMYYELQTVLHVCTYSMPCVYMQAASTSRPTFVETMETQHRGDTDMSASGDDTDCKPVQPHNCLGARLNHQNQRMLAH